jgi:hypothetical protein
MAAGTFVVLTMIAQILAGLKFMAKIFLDHVINPTLNSDDGLDILLGKEPLGAGSHPSGDDDADPSLR